MKRKFFISEDIVNDRDTQKESEDLSFLNVSFEYTRNMNSRNRKLSAVAVYI